MKYSSSTTNTTATLLLFALLSGAAPLTAAEKTSTGLDLARQLNEAFVDVSDRVSKSVVVIQVAYNRDSRRQLSRQEFEEENPWMERLPDSLRRYLLPDSEDEEPDAPVEEESGEPVFSGNGSGVIISEDGYILTNHHVVEGADKIRVRLKNGREFDAFVKGTDDLSEIAVIKINDDSVKGLPVVNFANSDKVRVGEYAIAIGTPFALDYSVTVGHVSALGRGGVVPWYMGGNQMDQDFIQTDANINPGNSGGPLVNLEGQVMGINTLIRGIGTGIGFAIPSNLAVKVSKELIENGKFERAWLGIGIRNIREYSSTEHFAPNQKSGLVVANIPRGAPAEGSGLKASDVIVAVNGIEVTNIGELRAQVRSQPLGSTLTLDVVRGTENLEIEVKTGRLAESQIARGINRIPVPEPKLIPLGITVQEIDSKTAEDLDLPETRGVLVTEVKPDSVASKRGISRGTIITDINHQPVKSVGDYKKLISKADRSEGVLINFLDADGNGRFEVIKE